MQAKSSIQAEGARAAILRAFFQQVLNQRYSEISIAKILASSGVARSTFYQHFANKDDLLDASLQGLFSVLASIVRPDASTSAISRVLAHFFENRAIARTILSPSVRPKVVHCLARCIAKTWHKAPVALPIALASIALAEATLGLISAWLREPNGCSAEQLASALQRLGLAWNVDQP